MLQVKRFESKDENVLKYVFNFEGSAVAEAVLYKYPTYEDRTVICCSTQSGCPVGCRFCGAGDSFARSLKAEEIVAQVDYLFADKGINTEAVKRCQIMFMSMGEPMLNFSALEEAIRILHGKYPRFALLISTSAPKVDFLPLIVLSQEISTIGLQFSVHESTDEARNKLIPFKSKYTLKEMATIGEVFLKSTGRKPFFNYCAHENNTSDQDVENLLAIYDPMVFEATISVVCERDETVAVAKARQRKLATDFMDKMMQKGYSTRCFDPAGQDDIAGGCGMLHQYSRWVKENPDKVKKSVGYGLPVVHSPR
jgi:23S rRNA (adenine2503-C2)-methyltransferase